MLGQAGHCSVNVNLLEHYTCFSRNELISIINAFNNYIIKGHIKLCNNKNDTKVCINVDKSSLITYQNEDDTKTLWVKIYDALKPLCSYEYCWTELKFLNLIDDKKLKQKLMYFTFKPRFYKNGNNWLNTDDIDDVMKQYESMYSNFFYLGAKPCDFYKYEDIPFKKIKNFQKVGIIFNLDKTKQSGSHWTSCFINNLSNNIYYFDSAGDKPNKCIYKFFKMLFKKNDKYTLYINEKKHQRGNSECGVYSIYFLLKQLVHNNDINDMDNISVFNTKKRITDSEMKNFRKKIFIIKNK